MIRIIVLSVIEGISIAGMYWGNFGPVGFHAALLAATVAGGALLLTDVRADDRDTA